jgi:TRAP-type C4-dicarboxylate transport system substrate-binding protein
MNSAIRASIVALSTSDRRNETMSGRIHRRTLAIATMAALAVGCAGNTVSPDVAGNKEGGAGQNRLSLTIVTGEGSAEEAGSFAKAVASVSNGAIEVKVDNHTIVGDIDPGYETNVIKYVAEGKAQLGFVASRAFDTVGVKSFVGLQAPFLIDSYQLEDRVLSSDGAKALLDGTRSAGVVGLSYLQGPMRRPLGLTRDLVEPSDYVGAKIGIRASALTEMTMKALGATPVAFKPGDTSGLDGMEAHLGLIDGSKYDQGAKSLTGNVMFWSRPGVIFANAKSFDGLTPEQQGILRSAGEQAYRESVASIPANGVAATDKLCRRGLKFLAASQAAGAALRAAVQPVYDEIEKDPDTKATIAAIEALKTSSTAAPDAADCTMAAVPSPSVAPTAVSPIDGTWEVCYNRDEFLAAGPVAGEDQPGNIGCGTKTFRMGRFWELTKDAPFDPGHPNGTFTVDGTTVTLFSGPDAETWQFSWSLFQDTLTFKKSGTGGPTGFIVKPWHKVADARSPIEGTYATSFTRDELAASPLLYDPTEANDGNWGDFSLAFDGDGRVVFTQRNDRTATTTSGTYSVTGDTVELAFSEGANVGETFHFRWSLYRDSLTFQRDGDKEGPTPYLVKAWTRVP